MQTKQRVDVVILGAGLAGLSLAQHLLMNGNKTILHLEKREKVPVARQKVGESNVQVAGYYYGKVLDLEEYLFHEHLMKYNLRFMWKTPGLATDDFANYSQSFIRTFSNIPCYQLDRNKFEGELLRRNRCHQNYELLEGVANIEVDLETEGEPHAVRFQQEGKAREVLATWVVDATGRNRFLARNMDLKRTSEITHHASFFWVDGTVNIEKLTKASPRAKRLSRSRQVLGHSPMWLATNHFCGEGFWFWVIPLQGRTSFGLVFDQSRIDPRDVSSQEKLLDWLFREFPLFEPVLKDREIIDFSTLRHFSHDCALTIHRDRWAMSGESGRFTDPLYSPGGDTISIHNTLIVDAILEEDPKALAGRIAMYESLFKTVYRSFVPTFHLGYQALGDQETFAMKYTWELSVYFVFYVFPFINDLFTERNFLFPYFRRFSVLGEINRSVQKYIAAYFYWKQGQPESESDRPVFFDFTSVETLKRAESTFYRVGVTAKRAVAEIENQLEHLEELARLIMTHIDTAVLGDPDLLTNKAYVAGIDPASREFDVASMERERALASLSRERYSWSMDAGTFWRNFQAVPQTSPVRA